VLVPAFAAPWPTAGFLHEEDWSVWLSTAIAAASPAYTGPAIAPAFKADVLVGNAVARGGRGTYVRDAARQRWRLKVCSSVSIFRPDDHLILDQLAMNISDAAAGYNLNFTAGEGSDSVCKVIPSPYSDTFAALAVATHQGSSTVAGEPCELWRGSLKSPVYSVNVSACIAADGVPRQYNTSSSTAYKAAAGQFMTFSNVSVDAQPEEAFRPSDACRSRYPLPPCAQGPVESQVLYRVRSPTEPSSLADRNLGDALGDMAFFCALGDFDEGQAVTSWSVQVNSSWGQYAYCRFAGGKNSCFGSTGKLVGRESAMGLGKGHLQGQCSDNADVGSWFSMPAEGQCPDGVPIGQGGCTWSAKLLRTVSAKCILEDRGLKASCKRERGHAPMLRSAAIFRTALETSDPAQGGCPDAGEVSMIV